MRNFLLFWNSFADLQLRKTKGNPRTLETNTGCLPRLLGIWFLHEVHEWLKRVLGRFRGFAQNEQLAKRVREIEFDGRNPVEAGLARLGEREVEQRIKIVLSLFV